MSETKLEDLKPVKSEGVNLKQFHNQQVEIAKIEIIQVPSKFTVKDKQGNHLLQWVLRVSSPVLTAIGEGDTKIEFRASELFNLIQDDEGKLIGYPESPDSNLMKFAADIGVKTPQEFIGKKATIKAYDKTIDGKIRTYLKFKY